MNDATQASPASMVHDLRASVVVFLVALPLCLGIALASGAPLFSGLVAGMIGGVIVGMLSGSQTSVSGPAAGLTAIVAAQIGVLGSFTAFQLSVVIAGIVQLLLGFARAGFLAAFVPSSVIKGLLAAIGVILILKQIPHVAGHHADPIGDLSFRQPDHENTFSELTHFVGNLHPGAAAIGLLSVALLIVWQRIRILRDSVVPAPLIIVIFGVGTAELFQNLGPPWLINPARMVNVPTAETVSGFVGFFRLPDFSAWANPAVYFAAVTIAAVASLETLLNLEAIDKLDPQQRRSPPSRELLAQGVGNCFSGLIGGLPITSVVVRGSVNISAGARTKLSTVLHGMLLLVCVALLPRWLNRIPLSCLAAILLVTGFKLISPSTIQRIWQQGWPQVIPFAITVIAIVVTDLLTGILIGMTAALCFILVSSIRRPIRTTTEKHLRGDLLHIELADQVSFLNRAALVDALETIPRGGQVLLDARRTDYVDPDVLSVIRDFEEGTAPARHISVSLLGFRKKYRLKDRTGYVVHSTRELQQQLSPAEVLKVLKDGHARFRSGKRLTRDLGRQMSETAVGQHPLAVILSCIDSRTPAEIIFDLGLGDIFSIRVAGNVISPEVLGSAEYGCAVAGAKLLLVLGHTQCGAVTAAVHLRCSGETAATAYGCDHLDSTVREIQHAAGRPMCDGFDGLDSEAKALLIDRVARLNVLRSVEQILIQSRTLRDLERDGQVVIQAAMYDIANGTMRFLSRDTDV